MSILEKDRTDFQSMTVQEQRELISRFDNLCRGSQRSYKVLLNCIEREEEFCRTQHISLPKNYP